MFQIQKQSDEFARLLGLGPRNIVWRIVQETVRKHFAEATDKYAQLFVRAAETFDNLAAAKPDAEKGKDDLAAWLDDLHLDCDEGCAESHSHGTPKDRAQKSGDVGEKSRKTEWEKYVSNTKLSGNMVALHRCSRCGNPSAILKKCSGCSMARYVCASSLVAFLAV